MAGGGSRGGEEEGEQLQGDDHHSAPVQPEVVLYHHQTIHLSICVWNGPCLRYMSWMVHGWDVLSLGWSISGMVYVRDGPCLGWYGMVHVWDGIRRSNLNIIIKL